MKHFNFKRLLLSMIVAVGVVCPQLSFAQGTHATIVGKITDTKGETVIGATVQVRNESTGFTTGVATNVNGDYTIQQIPLGTPYTITAKYVGYGDQKKSGYTLNQGDMLRVNFVMKEESVTMDEIQVVANSLRKSVSNAGAATVISAKNIAVLPVNGRNFTYRFIAIECRYKSGWTIIHFHQFYNRRNDCQEPNFGRNYQQKRWSVFHFDGSCS